MKKLFFAMMTGLLLIACTNPQTENPFFSEFTTPYSIPPFDLIESRHFLPAFQEGIRQQQAEIDAIINNPDAPTFANTVAAVDFSGRMLRRVSLVFFQLAAAETNEGITEIQSGILPVLSEHQDNIFMNSDLFQRVRILYNQRETLGLNSEQNRLLELYYSNFVRAGAALPPAEQARMREINSRLSTLEFNFGQNVLAEINDFQRFVADEAELVGLPNSVRQAAAEAATAAGRPGEWLFTIQRTSFTPVLQHSTNRALREELFTAFSMQGQNGNENDNREVVSEIVSLRFERAQMLGFESFSHYALDIKMAQTPERVMEFLHDLWVPILNQAKIEAAELQAMMNVDLPGEPLRPWDWWFYAERIREERYALSDEELRPFFRMEYVLQGAFDVSTKVFGVYFEQIFDVPVYHPDVDVFRVTNYDGSFLGILFTDFFPRPGKRNGAWMGSYRIQYIKDGVNHRPIITNVGNFMPPTADRPSLLTLDNVRTLFHEIGHALHGLLSQVTYPSIAGVNTPIDFVELPSQLMPHWARQPEVLRMYARHYRTGEVIPEELIERIQRANNFNVGFDMTERLATAFLDMDWHMITTTERITDVLEFERQSMERIGLISEIIPRWPTTYLRHSFSGMYASLYYSYTWCAVLDSDAFQAFYETGDIFNREVGMRFRREILERGGSEDAMTMYINFRGAEPNPKYLLRDLGLLR
jgi:peptidyl-dipeptidase Dcp